MDTSWVPPEEKGHRVVRFPERPNVLIDRRPFEAFRLGFESGDEGCRGRVERAIEEAEKWAGRSDAWFLSTIWDQEPRGLFTCACPIHPFLVRYYSYFEWSLEDPWRLYCSYCKEEGREYDYYPNPRYSDDGGGCFPTDEVWREDHDEAWSQAHNGIPWDHWDGETHGYMEPTNAYYFKGLCWMNAFRALSGGVLHRLGEAYQFALKLRSDEAAAGRFAHKAKAILVTLSRAFLGDGYLAGVLEISEAEFLGRLADFYEPGTEVGAYPGYRLNTPQDYTAGDPKRPLDASGSRYGVRGASIYPGVWNWKASEADDLMVGYGLIAEAFDEAECAQGLKDAALRIVTSVEGDAERLKQAGQRLKRGIVEYTLHPYTLVTGADNLSPSTQMPRLALGRLVGEDEIVENVARDIVCFLHNFFTGDGLGKEGSPSYTTWGIGEVMAALHGEVGNFDRTAPYFDGALGGLNLLSMPIFRYGLGNYLYTGFPNGRPVTWEDCVIRASMPLHQLEQVEAMGGGVPEVYREYLNFKRNEAGEPVVTLKLPMVLPSRLLGENRKGVLRSGAGENTRALSVDFTERVGHYHMAPLNLTLFAKGHELATDLGYLGSTHFMTVDWIKTFPAHNTVVIRTEDGDPMVTDNLRGDVRYFKDLPGVVAMDAAEEDASELAKAPGTDRYQRTVAMIDVDETDAYVVDIFRVNGGRLHDWTFHSNGHRFETEGVELAERPDREETLYEYSGFSFTPGRRTPGQGARWGSERVSALRAGKSSGGWTATWGDVTEFPGEDGTPEVDREVFLKLHMLDEVGSEVIVGTGPAQRWIDNRDMGEEMSIVTVRRQNGEGLDTFAAVYEPYRQATFIEQVARVEVTSADPEAVGLKVVHRRGTDLILSGNAADGRSEVLQVETAGHVLQTDGELAAASFDGEGLRSVSVIGGTFAQADGQRVEAAPTVEGTLVGFDDVEKSLTVKPDGELPGGDALAGEVVTIRHRERTSAYTIRSVEEVGDGTVKLHLDGWPHLAIGYLLVTGVESDRVWVEPPPVLQGKVENVNLFKVEADRSLRFLQPSGERTNPGIFWMWSGERGADGILDEWGTLIRSRHYLTLEEAEQVSAGEEVAFSLLHPGVDRFGIMGSGHDVTQ